MNKMTTYIAILRGINVGGKNILKMDELKSLFESLSFQHVTTYIQSGNIVFQSELMINEIENLITINIQIVFGYTVPVIVMTREYLKQIINDNPFTKDKEAFLHCTFLSDDVNESEKELIESKKLEKEEVHFGKRVVYLCCPEGYGNTKLTNTFIEKKCKVVATTRNWKTANELLRIANQIR